MSTYLCGIDIGGTFTDCVVVDEAGRVTTGKAPSPARRPPRPPISARG